MMRTFLCSLLLIGLAAAQDKPVESKPHPMAGFRFRSIGPSVMSGRVVGFAVHPDDRSKYFAAVACGGVWKTNNAGVSWTPVFDNEGSYSIGCITMDPKNPNTLWVGTGENNSQRSVGYGDGVYKSIDGGRSWKNVGLKNSEHIGKIVIDPRDSDIVYVAAQGPLWSSGGDRGLYKTTDGGKTWTKILNISDNTGVTSFVVDPRNPDLILAASYQRRRHVWTIVNGGPESALHRTTDGGKTWTKVGGLPGGDLGRIGLAMAPSDPDTVYTIVEAADKSGGIWRTTDRGVTWEKRNDFNDQAQYYSHLVVDPKNKDRVYVMNVYIQVSDDGCKTLKSLGERWKHVDNHEIWIDPKQPDYYLVGCDGGIYESYDRAANWRHISNLPVTQFYDVTCEQTDTPFYKVYGGTQDNNTLGGPARSLSGNGIGNSDWHTIVGGDGFHCKVDPKDPNIVYAEYQYGGLVRFDWRTGQRVPITPEPAKGEASFRWNWDSPLTISPHSNTRLYYAANKLFRSDDRGDSWTAVSPDLTRQLNRDLLPVFGKIQPPEAIFKHVSTSLFGNIVALDESPVKEGMLIVGTDDGLIQISDDAGKTWRKIDKFPGVPEMTYVARVLASRHDANVIYAAFDNHKNGDFKPYLLKSSDAGQTWQSLAATIPPRGSVLAIAEDHINSNLLFIGTEFGLYVTVDGGKEWSRMRNGLPPIPVRDLCIQKPMGDLLVGTFGRGFYILDDYSPLRNAKPESFGAVAAIYPIRDAFQYMKSSQYGGGGKASLGEAIYFAENPAYGATITYHLKDGFKSRKAKRIEEFKKDPMKYPTPEELRAEEEEESAAILLTIHDETGLPIRVINAPASAGVHRVTWDLRGSAPYLGSGESAPAGLEVWPGKYKVTISKKVDGVITLLTGPVDFNVKYVGPKPLPEADVKQLAAFQKEAVELQKSLFVTQQVANELTTRLGQIKQAIDQTPTAPAEARESIRKVVARHNLLLRQLNGDSFLAGRQENPPTSTSDRVGTAARAIYTLVDKPTGTQRQQAIIAREELQGIKDALKQTLETDVKNFEALLEKIGAPYTPGRGFGTK